VRSSVDPCLRITEGKAGRHGILEVWVRLGT
jgi:hypothetical protein